MGLDVLMARDFSRFVRLRHRRHTGVRLPGAWRALDQRIEGCGIAVDFARDLGTFRSMELVNGNSWTEIEEMLQELEINR